MKKLRKMFRSPAATAVMFVLAVALLLTGTIGGTRAALTMRSQDYVAEVRTKEIGIQLVENDILLPDEATLLENLVPKGETFKPGVIYDEELAVKNTGTIDEYVRVILYKYWIDEKGNKVTTLSPDLIRIEFANQDKWQMADEVSTSGERCVLYYTDLMHVDDISVPFTDRISVDGKILDDVRKEIAPQPDGSKIITMTYEYDGARFVLEAQADGVQTHNAEAAMLSAWGVKAKVSNDTMTLQK